jgi:hypothetical protein
LGQSTRGWCPVQLLVETAIESGLRWGELAELRVRDLDIATRMLTVRRKVTEVNREFHPDGRRFLVKLYPKDKEYRRLKLSPQTVAKLQAHIKARGLGPDGLLFARRAAAPAPLRVVTEPEVLEYTEPNDAGRRYRHGTLSALQRRAMPVPPLPGRLRRLPGRAPRGTWRFPAPEAYAGWGRAHRPQLVPAHGLAPGLRSGWSDGSAALS